jgi:yeast amino acid transporter
MTAGERTENWFEVYLSGPIVLLFFVVFKLWKRTSFERVKDIDITSGRREMDLSTILAEERVEQAGWPRWKKVYKFSC